MAGIYIFSEDRALAAQLLTPALELKEALGEPLIALARDEAQATELSTLGPDKVLVVGDSATWIEGLGEPLAALVAQAPAWCWWAETCAASIWRPTWQPG